MIAVQAAIDGGDEHGVVDALDRQGVEVGGGAAGLAHLDGRLFRNEADAQFTEDREAIHFFRVTHCFHPWLNVF